MKKLRLVSNKKKNHVAVHSVTESLSKLLANTYALYLKTQNYHWNVTGPNFIMLHTLFEQQYEELADAADLIAERLRALNVYSPGSFAEFSKLMTIAEAKKGASWKVMIESLAHDHDVIIKMMDKCLDLDDIINDEATQDLLIERLRAHQKTLWMLRSHLE